MRRGRSSMLGQVKPTARVGNPREAGCISNLCRLGTAKHIKPPASQFGQERRQVFSDGLYPWPTRDRQYGGVLLG